MTFQSANGLIAETALPSDYSPTPLSPYQMVPSLQQALYVRYNKPCPETPHYSTLVCPPPHSAYNITRRQAGVCIRVRHLTHNVLTCYMVEVHLAWGKRADRFYPPGRACFLSPSGAVMACHGRIAFRSPVEVERLNCKPLCSSTCIANFCRRICDCWPET